jgi:D-alanine-D-alanine ligase
MGVVLCVLLDAGNALVIVAELGPVGGALAALPKRNDVSDCGEKCLQAAHSHVSSAQNLKLRTCAPGTSMDITILAYLEPGEERPDVVMEQVAAGLAAGGHKTSILTLRHDVNEIVDGLKTKKPNLVFNLVESFGDDILGGQMGVAGLLDLLELPYTGGGPGEIFLQEDKALSKKLLAFEQIPYPDFATFAPNADFETGGNLRMPMFVKPLRMDASIGIDERSLVRNTQQLMERVQYIHKTFGDAALAEEYIEGREFYVGVIGNQELTAFPPLEMDFSGLRTGSLRIMDKEAKFDETSERFHGTTAILPDLEPALKARLQKVSLQAYRALRVRDYGRIDLRLTETGEIFVIEVNANCYLEQKSEFASAAAAHGFEYPKLLNHIVELAIERWKHRSRAQKRRMKARALA